MAEREIDRAREREKETERVSKVVADLIPKTTLFTTTLYVSVLFLSHPLSLLLYIIHLSSFFNPLILIHSLTQSINQSLTDSPILSDIKIESTKIRVSECCDSLCCFIELILRVCELNLEIKRIYQLN